jgi:tRNA threonylcarbamoyladenosine biosynthesis protein TsaB
VKGPWLALDTAAPRAVIALVEAGEVRAARFLEETRRHAEALAGALEECLAEAGLTVRELAGLAAGRGPGSFVGVRVGLAHAKGLATAVGVPLLGLCSLTALGAGAGLPEGEGLAVLDARRGQLYVRAVRRQAGSVSALGEARALSPEDAREALRGACFVVGGGLELLGAHEVPEFSLPGPAAEGLAAVLAARLAADSADERASVVPAYCRLPDAKLPTTP